MSDLPNRHVPVSFAIKILRRSITREYFWSDNVISWQNPKRTPDLSPSHSLITERLFLSSFFPSRTLYLHPQHLSQPLPRGAGWGGGFFDPSPLSWRERPGSVTLDAWTGPTGRWFASKLHFKLRFGPNVFRRRRPGL